jgi:hypothetical protein
VKLPLQVTLHNTDALPGVEEVIRGRAARFD